MVIVLIVFFLIAFWRWIEMFYKKCTKCGKLLPANKDYFHTHTVVRAGLDHWHGLRPECKECRNKLRREKYKKEVRENEND